MNPIVPIAIGVVGAILSGVVAYTLASGQRSGRVATTEAETLWSELRAHTADITAEVKLLRAEAITTRQEAEAMRRELSASREESVRLRAETEVTRAEMAALRSESEALRGQVASLREELVADQGVRATMREEVAGLGAQIAETEERREAEKPRPEAEK